MASFAQTGHPRVRRRRRKGSTGGGVLDCERRAFPLSPPPCAAAPLRALATPRSAVFVRPLSLLGLAVSLLMLTVSVCAAQSNSSSASITSTRAGTRTPSVSATSAPSYSASGSGTKSYSSSISATRSVAASVSVSLTASKSVVPSVSMSRSGTPSTTISPTFSASRSFSSSISGSVTPTRSVSSSLSPSTSVSSSITLSKSVTSTVTKTLTASPTVSASVAATVSVSATRSLSTTVSSSLTATLSGSSTVTWSTSKSPTLSPTRSATSSLSATPSRTSSVTLTTSSSPSITPSSTPGLRVLSGQIALPPGAPPLAAGAGNCSTANATNATAGGGCGGNATAAAVLSFADLYPYLSNATLLLRGVRLRSLCIPSSAGFGVNNMPVLRGWTAAPLLSVLTCSETDVVVSYDATKDAAVWLYAGANLTAAISGVTSTVALAPLLPPVSCNASVASWGDVLLLQGIGIGAPSAPLNISVSAAARGNGTSANATRLLGKVLPPIVPLLCSSVLIVGNDSVACTLGLVSSAWLGLPLSFAVTFALPAAPLRTPPPMPALTPLSSLRFGSVNASAAVPSANASVDGVGSVYLKRSGGVVLFSLPQPLLSSPTAAALGVAAAASWFLFSSGNASVGIPLAGAGVACAVLANATGGGRRTLSCAYPPGHGTDLFVRLSLCGGVLNVSGPVAAYAPPNASAIVSAATGLTTVLLSGTDPTPLAWNVTLDSPFNFASIFSAAVAGVPCGSLAVVSSTTASSLVSCGGWRAAAAIPVFDAANVDAMPLSFSFNWGAVFEPRRFSSVSMPGTSVIARPTLDLGSGVQPASPTIVQTGGVILLTAATGTSFCNSIIGSCSVLVKVGAGYDCTAPALLGLQSAFCLSPRSVQTNDTTFPYYNITVAAAWSALPPGPTPSVVAPPPSFSFFSRPIFRIEFPDSATVVAAAPLPTTFIPSDSSAPFYLQRSIEVAILPSGKGTGGALFPGPINCSLTTLSGGVLVIPAAGSLTTINFASGKNGTVNFGRIALQATFTITAISLSIACYSSNSTIYTTASTFPLVVNLAITPLYVVPCAPFLPSVTQSQTTLPPFSLALVLNAARAQLSGAAAAAACLAGNATQDVDKIDPEGSALYDASTGRLSQPTLFPRIACIASAASTGVNASTPVVQGGLVAFSTAPPLGASTFTPTLVTSANLNIGGLVGEVYRVSLSCTIGASIQVPPVPGSDSVSVESNPLSQLLLITGCAVGTQPSGPLCLPCASGHYSEGGSGVCYSCPDSPGVSCSLGAMRLLPGFFRSPADTDATMTGATQLFACGFPDGCVVNDTARLYACAYGYTGPLCGVCDASVSYSQVGLACAACFPSSSNDAILGALIAALALILGVYVSRRSQNDPHGRAIALRILMAHVQMMGALRALRASGSQLYLQVMAWTSVFSPAILMQGPAACSVRPDFFTVFYMTLFSPLLASAFGIVVLMCVSFVEGAFCARASLVGAKGSRTEGAVALVKERWREQRHVGILLFVAQLAYMPIVNESIGVYNCTVPIGGVRYLANHLDVPCEGPAYVAAAASGGISLAFFGLGFPILIYRFLTGASPKQLEDKAFFQIWGFLYGGYRRTPLDGALAPPSMRRLPPRSSLTHALAEGAALSAPRRSSLAMTSTSGPPNLLAQADAGSSASASPRKSVARRPSIMDMFESKKTVVVVPISSPALEDGWDDDDPTEEPVVRRPSMSAAAASSGTGARRASLSAAAVTIAGAAAAAPSDPSAAGASSSSFNNDNAAADAPAASQLGSSSGVATAASRSGLKRKHRSTRRFAAFVEERQSSLVYWETTVMIRKFGVVVIANVINDTLAQITAIILWVCIAAYLHGRLRPYVLNEFNVSEGASLFCIIVTAALCNLVIGYTDSSPRGLGVTVMMLVLNFAVLTYLIRSYLSKLCARPLALFQKHVVTHLPPLPTVKLPRFSLRRPDSMRLAKALAVANPLKKDAPLPRLLRPASSPSGASVRDLFGVPKKAAPSRNIEGGAPGAFETATNPMFAAASPAGAVSSPTKQRRLSSAARFSAFGTSGIGSSRKPVSSIRVLLMAAPMPVGYQAGGGGGGSTLAADSSQLPRRPSVRASSRLSSVRPSGAALVQGVAVNGSMDGWEDDVEDSSASPQDAIGLNDFALGEEEVEEEGLDGWGLEHDEDQDGSHENHASSDIHPDDHLQQHVNSELEAV